MLKKALLILNSTSNRILWMSSMVLFSIISFSSKTIEPKNKIALGKKLFFEKKLSKTNTISCASCHKPEFAFADTSAVSIGVEGKKGKRNTPSTMNMLNRPLFFYDGRANTLESQAIFPIEDHLEMDINIDTAIMKITKEALYQKLFKSIYNEWPNKTNVLNAIALYEQSLESYSPFDQYMGGDTLAISASARRGHTLFMADKTKCFECHFSPDFTGDEFKNIGLFDGNKRNDSGRFLITKNKQDIGKFKVPGLRNIGMTAPYMHDGSFKTIRECILYYQDIYKVVPHPINEDSLVKQAIILSNTELVDLENFLLSLTDYIYLKKNKPYAKSTARRRRK